jgi:quinoprotein glucose dehydrogenase
MPDLGGPDLTVKDTWGLTPVDRLLCSIELRASVYKGRFTPPSLKPFIVYPGFAGGVDWGGVAVDPTRNILVVNTTHLANRNHLVMRAELEQQGIRALGDPGVVWPPGLPAPQQGTPYGVVAFPWLSPLGLPCQRPPWGSISGIDLRTRRLLWTRPFGSTYDNGPLGMALHIAAPAGVPNQGGAVVTASGLTFIAATIDAFLRGFDTSTGQELWRSRLPTSGQASPISYTVDGRQYVVVVAGGHALLRTPPGDYVIAFALPTHSQ